MESEEDCHQRGNFGRPHFEDRDSRGGLGKRFTRGENGRSSNYNPESKRGGLINYKDGRDPKVLERFFKESDEPY
jgi:hypothetical protein